MTAPDLQIVVPVYNEAENFPRFYRSVREHVRTPHDILVVYDMETDTTVPVIRDLMRDDPSLRLLRNPERGVLGALRTGLAAAPGGAVVVSMADGSDDHRCVDIMYEKYRAGCHLVAASRYSAGGEQRGGPWLKGVLSRTAGLALHRLAGIPTTDPTNNFKLYSKTLLDRFPIESRGGFEVALELTVKAHLAGMRIEEVPTVWSDRTAGTSQFRLASWLPHYLRWFRMAFGKRTPTANGPA